MVSVPLAATLVDELGIYATALDIGGHPNSIWCDIAITSKRGLADALHKLEQRLAHIRENLDSRELAAEFERARVEKDATAQAPRA
jgi:prephenate dehydrogenase